MASQATDTGLILFSYTSPFYQNEQPDGSKETVALYTVGIGILIFLKALLDEGGAGRMKRSIQQDQLELFMQIEDNISAMGVDGHACVLRFICEMQNNRFSKSSIFGELFTLMFTPKQGDDYTILKEYIEAEMVGQESDIAGSNCLQKYITCPISVFTILRKLQGGLGFSTPADKPLNTTINNSYSGPSVAIENNSKDND